MFIYRRLQVKPRYDRAFLRPLLSSAVMGAAAWAVYGIAARVLHVADGGRLSLMIAMCLAIGIAVIVYLLMIIVTRSITAEDMKLIPKGEKIASLLRIR